MIIFGTRGVNSTLSKGDFNCPQCDSHQPYIHKKVTKFFTLYFIPIIPLGRLGDYVECQNCKGTFVSNILDYNADAATDRFLAEYEKAIKHTMVLIMLADGKIDEKEMHAVHDIINKFSHHDITFDQLEQYVRELEKSPEDITTYLKRVSPSLNGHGKEIILKCALTVALADGNMDSSEFDLIKKMAQTMEITDTHLKGILHEMTAPENSGFSNN